MALKNEYDLLNYIPSSPKNKRRNLTKAESQVKTNLFKNSDIVIKKADKGSAVVVQNRTEYINEGLRQLSDRDFYCPQEENLTISHNTLSKKQIDEMVSHKEISPKTGNFLFVENPCTAKFYLLPKIHKKTRFPHRGDQLF